MIKNRIKSLYISYNGITEPIVESQVIPYLRELSKKGIKFYLLTFEKKRITACEKDSIKKTLEKEFPKGARLEWFSLKYHKRPTVPATVFDIIAGFIRSAYIIIKNNIDIVHARAITAALIGWPAAKLLSKKIIFDTRGIDSEEYVDAGAWRRGGFKHKITRYLEDLLITSSDHVVVLTRKFLKILKNKYHSKKIEFSVIPCAVDTNRFNVESESGILSSPRKACPERSEGRGSIIDSRPSLRSGQAFRGNDRCKKRSYDTVSLGIKNKFVIVYMGSLGTWYMFEEMVDFFKRAGKFIDNAHFLILTPWEIEYAQDVMKKHDVDMKDVRIDAVSHKSIPDYLSTASVGIFFIKSVFSKLSSSPVKLGEYLASGLPVVINRGIGDTEEIVRDNRVGVIVESFNEAGYDKALSQVKALLKDKGLRQRCMLTAEKHLSLKAAVDKYNYIYNHLMSK